LLQPLQQAVEVGDLFNHQIIMLKKMTFLMEPFLAGY
jgi:hypothetical protein